VIEHAIGLVLEAAARATLASPIRPFDFAQPSRRAAAASYLAFAEAWREQQRLRWLMVSPTIALGMAAMVRFLPLFGRRAA